MSKKYKKCIYTHTKKYCESPSTDQKKSNSVRRREKIMGQTKNLPTPIKNEMVCP
jgi:hypothetical protein